MAGKHSEDLDRLLRMLHYYADQRMAGRVNVSGRSAIVDLIRTCLSREGDHESSPWDVYSDLFERHQDASLPFWRRSPRSIHRGIDRTFRKAYGRHFGDRDIIRFYVAVGGQDVQGIVNKYQHKERVCNP